MEKLILVFFCCLFPASLLVAQNTILKDSSNIILLNQQIDEYVIQRKVTSLDSFYAADFNMTHGDGRIDKKTGWLNAVVKSNYTLRQHDSVMVEMHPGVAIVRGKMLVQKAGDKTAGSSRKYIRVFAIRENRWQLISHFTIYSQ